MTHVEEAIGRLDKDLLAEYARNEIRIALLEAEMAKSPAYQLLVQARQVQVALRQQMESATTAQVGMLRLAPQVETGPEQVRERQQA